MSRPLVWTLYAGLVFIWSSTWVAIKIGLEDMPPLLGAGIRFAIAGLGLLRDRAADGPAAAHRPAAGGGARAAAVRGRLRADLLGRAVRAVGPGGRALRPDAALQRVLAALLLAGEPLRPRLVLGIASRSRGLSLAFAETLELGDGRFALAAAIACAAAPLASAIGNVAIKRAARRSTRRAQRLGDARAAARCCWPSPRSPRPGEVTWTAGAVGSIAYLAVIGSAVPFVTLTILLRELPAVTMSYITLLLPFGALAFGAALYDEPVTPPPSPAPLWSPAGCSSPSGPRAGGGLPRRRLRRARVAHHQLHVAVALAPARVGAAVLAVVGVRVVERELARRSRRAASSTSPTPSARVGGRVVVEDRSPDRDGPVGVVDDVEQPRLLRPVDVRGGRDLPEAALGRPVRRVARRGRGCCARGR